MLYKCFFCLLGRRLLTVSSLMFSMGEYIRLGTSCQQPVWGRLGLQMVAFMPKCWSWSLGQDVVGYLTGAVRVGHDVILIPADGHDLFFGRYRLLPLITPASHSASTACQCHAIAMETRTNGSESCGFWYLDMCRWSREAGGLVVGSTWGDYYVRHIWPPWNAHGWEGIVSVC